MTLPILYCKASGRDPSKMECPFCHYVAVAMELAGKKFTLKPTTKEQKPHWLLDLGGSMPCLAENEDGLNAITESAKIAAVVLPPTRHDEMSLQIAQPLFPAIAKFIKSIDANLELEEKLLAALDLLEKRLTELKGDGQDVTFFSGSSITLGLSDASIATKPYVLTVAGEHFKDYKVSSERYPNLLSYMQAAFQTPEFLRTKYDEADMIYGWTEARTGAH